MVAQLSGKRSILEAMIQEGAQVNCVAKHSIKWRRLFSISFPILFFSQSLHNGQAPDSGFPNRIVKYYVGRSHLDQPLLCRDEGSYVQSMQGSMGFFGVRGTHKEDTHLANKIGLTFSKKMANWIVKAKIRAVLIVREGERFKPDSPNI